ncbi:hypothetical protein ACWEQL_35200, partial [Kitasatospora sp. NPDC004240]
LENTQGETDSLVSTVAAGVLSGGGRGAHRRPGGGGAGGRGGARAGAAAAAPAPEDGTTAVAAPVTVGPVTIVAPTRWTDASTLQLPLGTGLGLIGCGLGLIGLRLRRG